MSIFSPLSFSFFIPSTAILPLATEIFVIFPSMPLYSPRIIFTESSIESRKLLFPYFFRSSFERGAEICLLLTAYGAL